jgi:hypothetical protein
MRATGMRTTWIRATWTRYCAIGAPVLLIAYGAVRLMEGLDGSHGPGFGWNLGHALFLIAFLLGGLMVGLRALLPNTAGWRAPVSNAAMVAGLVGSAAFDHVIVGDPFDGLPDLPDALMALGPLLFQLGLMTLLVMLATVRPRLLPAWTPVLVLVGFATIVVSLNLLPVAGLLLLGGLTPLTVLRRRMGTQVS